MQPTFDPIDEEFFGSYASFGIPKFDAIMKGGIPRGFMVIGITDPGAGAELFAKQFCSPAEEPENTVYVSTNETIESVKEVYRRFEWDESIKISAMGHEYNQISQRVHPWASRGPRGELCLYILHPSGH